MQEVWLLQCAATGEQWVQAYTSLQAAQTAFADALHALGYTPSAWVQHHAGWHTHRDVLCSDPAHAGCVMWGRVSVQRCTLDMPLR